MIWPHQDPAVLYANACLIRVVADETGGELCLHAVFNGQEEWGIVYEGMYYSQLDERAEGLTITLATEISPEELALPKYANAAARLYDDCGADEAFVRDMLQRGNHLYAHHSDNGEYIVLAKRVFLVE